MNRPRSRCISAVQHHPMLILLVIAMASAIASCGVRPGSADSGSSAGVLSFLYQGVAEPGYIDQTLTIKNTSDGAIAPTLEITPLDEVGGVVSGIKVRTAYGSDRGELLVPPGKSIEILAFDGDGADRVSDVKVVVRKSDAIDSPSVESDVEASPVDEANHPAPASALFDAVALTNPNSSTVTVRVVYLIYNTPAPGEPQQVQVAVPIAGPTSVAGNARIELPLSSAAKAANRKFASRSAASVKAYFSR